jgi:hypothetical protein
MQQLTVTQGIPADASKAALGRWPKRIYCRLGVLVSVVALAASLGGTTAAADYGPLAEYQTAFSVNCDNPGACGTNLGGFWGWAVFNRDGSAEAQLTGCSHMVREGPASGAIHFISDTSGPSGWYIAPSAFLGLTDFWITNETDTFVGRTSGTIVVPSENADTGVPAVPGHYSVSSIFGFKAPPGFSIQIQITKIS